MTEVVGDVVKPSELILNKLENADLPASPPKGYVVYDVTNDKLVVWTGAAYETISST